MKNPVREQLWRNGGIIFLAIAGVVLSIALVPRSSGATQIQTTVPPPPPPPPNGGPPPVDPNVAFSDGPPHAGKLFLGVVVSFGPPQAFKVQRVLCRATLGGHFVRQGEGLALQNGKFIRASMRTYYDHQSGGPYRGLKPRLSAVTCAWRLPRTAAGKLLSLQAPGCWDACQDWGVTIWYQRYDYEKKAWSGLGDANYTGATWRVRR
jgi:hypothetical protein